MTLRLRYIGDLPETTVFGARFVKGAYTRSHGLDNDKQEVLRGNPTFQCDEDPADAEAPDDPAASETEAEVEAEHPPEE